MLQAEILDLKYQRLLTANATRQLTSGLKADFDYSFVVSYGSFEDEEYTMVEKNALLIDLSQKTEDILSNFSATTRNEIRRFDKIKELEFHNSISDRDDFFQFYKNCESDRNWHPVPKSELDNSKVLYVTYNGIPISGMSAYSHCEFMRIGRIFSLRRSFNVPQPNLIFGCAAKRIVFEFIQYAKYNGFKSLDLGGVDLINKQKSGITKFKLSFGGEIVPVIIGRHEKSEFTARKVEIRKMGYDIT